MKASFARVIATAMICFSCRSLPAEDTSPEPTEPSSLALAQSFQIEGAASESDQIELRPEPLLTFTNPVRGRDQSGQIFLWTRNDRPVAIASLWSVAGKEQRGRRLFVEMHSLSQSALRATLPSIANARRPFPTWTPPPLSIQWRPIGEAHANVSAGIGMTLLRRTASEFTASVTDKESGKPTPLRLLTSPLYRYQSRDVVFGAVFSFVVATDPEVLLLLEARKEPGGVQLQYAFARMTGRPLQVELQGTPVWSVDIATIWEGSQPYLFCTNIGPMP